MQEQGLGKLNILVAVYGLKTVTENISQLITDGTPETLSFTVNNKVIGDDGWLGQRKSLTIIYNYDGGDIQITTSKEGDLVNINPDKLRTPRLSVPDSSEYGKLSILAASYGPDDVTYKVKNLVSSYNTLSFVVDNTLFGDTWYGVAKTLVIVLGVEDEIKAVEIFTEREPCYIDLNDLVPAI